MSAGKAVHRLIEIVVEEVSLVDRAANNHRFLIVKRAEGETDHAMADLNEPNDDDDLDDDPSPGDTPAPTPVLELATKALAALTDAVEKLGAGAQDAEAVSAMAAELRAAADDLAKMVGAEPVAPQDPPADGGTLDAVRASIAEVRELLSAAAAAPIPAPEPPAPPPAAPTPPPTTSEPAPEPATKSVAPAIDTTKLDALLTQMEALGKGLQEQRQKLGQRMAQLEKHFGLPNSSPAGERPNGSKDDEDADSWSLDLNNPLDRENVDKSISFHDL